MNKKINLIKIVSLAMILTSVSVLGFSVLMNEGKVNITSSTSAPEDKVHNAKFYREKDHDDHWELMYETDFNEKEGLVFPPDVIATYDNLFILSNSPLEYNYIFTGFDTSNDGIVDISLFSILTGSKIKLREDTIGRAMYYPVTFDPSKIDLEELLENLGDEGPSLEDIISQMTEEDWENILMGGEYEGMSLEDLPPETLALIVAAALASPVAFVETNYRGPLYLRQISYSDMKDDSSGWEDPVEFDASFFDNNALNPLQYTAKKISNYVDEVDAFNATHSGDDLITPICKRYDMNVGYVINETTNFEYFPVPSYEFENTQDLKSDSFSLVTPPTDTEEFTYFGMTSLYPTYYSSGSYFKPTAENIDTLRKVSFGDSEITKNELKYMSYAKNTYMAVPDRQMDFFDDLFKDNSLLDKDSPNIIQEARDYIANLCSFTYFNNQDDASMDSVCYFLSTSHKGSALIFASSLTSMYRYLGYPARVVKGYYENAKSNVTMIAQARYHYWTEVYVKGLGWLTMDSMAGAKTDEDTSAYGLTNPVPDPWSEEKTFYVTLDSEASTYGISKDYDAKTFRKNDILSHLLFYPADDIMNIMSAEPITYSEFMETYDAELKAYEKPVDPDDHTQTSDSGFIIEDESTFITSEYHFFQDYWKVERDNSNNVLSHKLKIYDNYTDESPITLIYDIMGLSDSISVNATINPIDLVIIPNVIDLTDTTKPIYESAEGLLSDDRIVAVKVNTPVPGTLWDIIEVTIENDVHYENGVAVSVASDVTSSYTITIKTV